MSRFGIGSVLMGGSLLLGVPGVARAECTCEVTPSGDTTGATDRAALRACVDGLPESGGVVTLAAGDFYLDGGITLRSDLSIEGAGASSTRVSWVSPVTTKAYVFGWEGSSTSGSLADVAIRDLAIDGGDEYVIGVLVDGGGGAGRAERVTVRDVSLDACGEYGIHVKQTDGVFIREWLSA